MKRSSYRDQEKESKGGSLSLDLICLSHLRWNFVYQRPQHLLSRAARQQRVFFFEEPIFGDDTPHLTLERDRDGPYVAVPHLPHGLSETEQHLAIRQLLDEMIEDQQVEDYLTWFYTPMALKYARHLKPKLCVYDCMDQLSHFKGASREIPLLEQELFRKADVVFTGGQSLYESKSDLHHDVHAFPSSVDVPHFAEARKGLVDPQDQADIAGPRIGYLGVIDERIDIELIEAVARAKPDWQLIMVGPIVKIDPASLPHLPNVHYLGGKDYKDLPAYLAGWDIAMLPFARNDATRFISPTKTPEYLAAGRQVISTSIRDVVSPYGDKKLVAIADHPEEFIAAATHALHLTAAQRKSWLTKVDAYLSTISWDQTFSAMQRRLEKSLQIKSEKASLPLPRATAFLAAEAECTLTRSGSSGLMNGKIALAPG